MANAFESLVRFVYSIRTTDKKGVYQYEDVDINDEHLDEERMASVNHAQAKLFLPASTSEETIAAALLQVKAMAEQQAADLKWHKHVVAKAAPTQKGDQIRVVATFSKERTLSGTNLTLDRASAFAARLAALKAGS